MYVVQLVLTSWYRTDILHAFHSWIVDAYSMACITSGNERWSIVQKARGLNVSEAIVSMSHNSFSHGVGVFTKRTMHVPEKVG